VSFSSNTIHFPPLDHDIAVPTNGAARSIEMELSVPSKGNHRISVSILQQSRLVQILELRLIVSTP
jgi:hypothetical protein